MVVTGTSLAATAAAIDLSQRHPGLLFATAGIHPHHAMELDAEALRHLRELAVHPAVVAVGECGLDYFRNFSPREAQLEAFRQQLALAVSLDKPLFLHQRDAHGDFLAVLSEFLPRLPPAVAHCFTGTLEEAKAYLDRGLLIGITGWLCDERRGLHLREVVRYIPADRLMIETDAPYLLPRSLRPRPTSRRNEPAFLTEVLRAVADCRGETPEAVARNTTRCAEGFFRLGAPAPSSTGEQVLQPA
jgi:TatD DNase family protein